MKLSADQIREFEEQGYLVLPNLYSQAEMEILNAEVPGILATKRPEVIHEKGSAAPRSAFYVQTWNKAFELLARHPRLIEPGIQLLGSDTVSYTHLICASSVGVLLGSSRLICPRIMAAAKPTAKR